jgi:hypothetical protein
MPPQGAFVLCRRSGQQGLAALLAAGCVAPVLAGVVNQVAERAVEQALARSAGITQRVDIDRGAQNGVSNSVKAIARLLQIPIGNLLGKRRKYTPRAGAPCSWKVSRTAALKANDDERVLQRNRGSCHLGPSNHLAGHSGDRHERFVLAGWTGVAEESTVIGPESQILRVRNRGFGGEMTLKNLIHAVQKVHKYSAYHCFFCRGPM